MFDAEDAAEYADETPLAGRNRAFEEHLEGPDRTQIARTRIRDLRPRRLLDAGCGTGDDAAWIAAETGADVVAVDLTPRMVEITAARGIRAVEADLRELPFADASFDCALASNVLYHVPDPGEALAELARVLEPGGHLVALTGSNGDDGRTERWEQLFGEQIPRQPPLSFARENGAGLLRRHFREVEQIDCDAELVFETRESLSAYVDSLPLARGAGARVPDLTEPFRVPTSGTVFIARR